MGGKTTTRILAKARIATRARVLEALGLLIGVLALEEGLGESIGLKLLRR